jgi:hypothetical protein
MKYDDEMPNQGIIKIKKTSAGYVTNLPVTSIPKARINSVIPISANSAASGLDSVKYQSLLVCRSSDEIGKDVKLFVLRDGWGQSGAAPSRD